MAKGKVYLIGAGSGRPDLITVRGLNILKQAEVVIYDYLVDCRVLKEVPPQAELIGADIFGKKRYADTFGISQEKINQLMIKKAKLGKKVVRLKNGDPSIFGRLSQELEALNSQGIEYEIVPGVAAVSAAAAYAGIPLTDRRFSSSLAIVSGHEDPNKKESLIDWQAVSGFRTIALYMAVENLSKIAARLMAEGKPRATPAAVVSNAGDLNQTAVWGNLGNIAEKVKRNKIIAPAIFIIGEVVKFEKEFNWMRKIRRVLFTGLAEERFFEKGRTYFHLPLIKIEPLPDYRGFDRDLKRIKVFDWLIFSSRYGVEYFFRGLQAIGWDVRVLNGIKIAAVGNSTAQKLLTFGVRADLVPKQESAEGLLKGLRKVNLEGKRVFFPRSDIADKGLTDGLKKLGAEVTAAVAYRNVMPQNLPEIDLRFFDEIYFTSPSTVRNFKKRYEKVPKGVKVRWIGEITKRELAKQRMI